MALDITHSVIHGFEKEKNVAATGVVKKKVLLDSTQPSVSELVTGVANLMGHKSNSQMWGKFNDVGRGGLVPHAFARDVLRLSEAEVFLALSHLVIDELVKQADLKLWSTGGHVLFALGKEEERTSLLIAMIKQKSGLSLDQNLVPYGIIEIDMGKLHQAAYIRIDDFLIAQAKAEDGALEDDSDESNYLSFLSKRGEAASEYFVEALGCVVGISSARATSRIFEAVSAFFTGTPALNGYRRAAQDALTSYLSVQLQSDSHATLEGISHALLKIVGPDDQAHLEALPHFLNGEKYKIPTDFSVNEKALKKHTKVTLESDNVSIKFNRSALGIDNNSPIEYNKEARSLTIRRLSDDFIEKLDNALRPK